MLKQAAYPLGPSGPRDPERYEEYLAAVRYEDQNIDTRIPPEALDLEGYHQPRFLEGYRPSSTRVGVRDISDYLDVRVPTWFNPNRLNLVALNVHFALLANAAREANDNQNNERADAEMDDADDGEPDAPADDGDGAPNAQADEPAEEDQVQPAEEAQVQPVEEPQVQREGELERQEEAETQADESAEEPQVELDDELQVQPAEEPQVQANEPHVGHEEEPQVQPEEEAEPEPKEGAQAQADEPQVERAGEDLGQNMHQPDNESGGDQPNTVMSYLRSRIRQVTCTSWQQFLQPITAGTIPAGTPATRRPQRVRLRSLSPATGADQVRRRSKRCRLNPTLEAHAIWPGCNGWVGHPRTSQRSDVNGDYPHRHRHTMLPPLDQGNETPEGERRGTSSIDRRGEGVGNNAGSDDETVTEDESDNDVLFPIGGGGTDDEPEDEELFPVGGAGLGEVEEEQDTAVPAIPANEPTVNLATDATGRFQDPVVDLFLGRQMNEREYCDRMLPPDCLVRRLMNELGLNFVNVPVTAGVVRDAWFARPKRDLPLERQPDFLETTYNSMKEAIIVRSVYTCLNPEGLYSSGREKKGEGYNHAEDTRRGKSSRGVTLKKICQNRGSETTGALRELDDDDPWKQLLEELLTFFIGTFQVRMENNKVLLVREKLYERESYWKTYKVLTLLKKKGFWSNYYCQYAPKFRFHVRVAERGYMLQYVVAMMLLHPNYFYLVEKFFKDPSNCCLMGSEYYEFNLKKARALCRNLLVAANQDRGDFGDPDEDPTDMGVDIATDHGHGPWRNPKSRCYAFRDEADNMVPKPECWWNRG